MNEFLIGERVLELQLQQLIELLNSIDRRDSWRGVIRMDDTFYVKVARSHLDLLSFPSNGVATRCNKSLSINIIIFYFETYSQLYAGEM